MKKLIKMTILGLLAFSLAAAPAILAQDATTNAPAGAAATPVTKKKAVTPFHGNISALDATAGTFTVGTLELNITSASKISSTNGVPATLADFKVGDNVSGGYKKAADGKLTVTTLHPTKAKKKKAAAQ